MNIVRDEDFIAFSGVQESQNILPVSDFKDAVIASFQDPDMAGLKLPWMKTHGKFAMREGEVTVVAGVNGHGKSQLLGQVCAQTLPVAKWLVASLEMPVPQTIKRMVRQVAGMANPADGYISQIMDSMTDNLWIYDELDTVKPERILGVIDYAANKLGVKYFIIDSLMKCVGGTDDYNAQKAFVDSLCWSAKRNKIHICLVHHVRKSEREGKLPDKFDIKGAGEIVDLVDNAVIVHRNKDKERKVQEGKEVDELEPDTVLIVAKQRHAGIEDRFGLYFHKDSEQFMENPNHRPMQVVV